MAEMKEWYIFERMAEGNALFFVDLTKNEFDTVNRFLSLQGDGPDIGYAGSLYPVVSFGFKTREEAETYSKAARKYIWAYGGEEDKT